MLDAYSRVGRTKVVLYCALMVAGQRLTLRPKKSKVVFSLWFSNQHSFFYMYINVVSDLRHVGGFLLVLRFPPPIKLTATI